MPGGFSAYALAVNRRLSRQPYWSLVAELTLFALLLAIGIAVLTNSLFFDEASGPVIIKAAVATLVVSTPLIALSVSALRRQILGRRDLRRTLDLANDRLIEANEARAAAETATRDKSRLISNVSHELRTPLNAVVSYTELLTEIAQDRGLDDMVVDLQRVGRASTHLTDLVDRVFDLSGNRTQPINIRNDVQVSELVREIEALCLPLMARTANTFEIEVPADIGTIASDPLKLRQIVVNLVSNAAKFTNAGRIGLDVARQKGRRAGETDDVILFSVRDTGIGIAPKDIEMIFDPFARTEEAFGIPGAGLGLAISRGHARDLGGEISVQSTKGVGSTFTLAVPVTLPKR
ncbi:MAG: HAMP domain-containing sensor histidine kinase [Proteobacteria bacterium]|nr:HAMP domain-containing sensor histidine kinase [Pseudomonadota bacterium]MDA1060052.1 HAMP domain-containing sensor histidine kinase [Pseudomonadota bacterium]